MKKLFSLALALLLMVLPLVSLAEGTETDAVKSEPDPSKQVYFPVADMWTDVTPLSNEADTLHIGVLYEADCPANLALDAAFLMQRPNASIEYTLLDEQTLDAALREGTNYDLVVLPHGLIDRYAGEGLLHDFSETLLKSWPEGWVDFSAAIRAEDGKICSFPRAIRQNWFLWNEQSVGAKVFQKPDAHWTWTDFEALCQDVTRLSMGGSSTFLAYGSAFGGMDGFAYEFLKEYYCRLAAENDLFDAVEMGDRLLPLFKNIMNSHVLTTSAVRSLAQTDNGCPDMPLILTAAEEFPLPYGTSALSQPVLDGDSPRYLGQYDGFVMPKNAPRAELALSYLQNALEPQVINTSMFENMSCVFADTLPRWSIEPEEQMTNVWTADENGIRRCTETAALVERCRIYYDEDLTEKLLKQAQEQYGVLCDMRAHLLLTDARWSTVSRTLFDQIALYVQGQADAQAVCDAVNALMKQ